MKVIAAISAFLFIALAAMFGSNVSSAQTDSRLLLLVILLFVAVTSLLLGAIFGRTALRVATVSGGLALFMMWLPLQYYATEESFMRSVMALLLIVVAQIPPYLVGGAARVYVQTRLRRVN